MSVVAPPPPAPEMASRGFGVSRHRLPKSRRLRFNRQFRDAYAQERSAHGRYMVLFLRTAPDAASRLGVVASRRVGNSPERARAKRRLRELFRLHYPSPAPTPDDVVLVARRPVLDAPWPALVAEFSRLLSRAAATPSPSPAP